LKEKEKQIEESLNSFSPSTKRSRVTSLTTRVPRGSSFVHLKPT